MEDVGIVDLAILVLLCCGIGYGYLVSRRLERLRDALIAFGPVLAAFCEAVDRSEQSARDLRLACLPLTRAGHPPKEKPPATDDRALLMSTLTDFIRKGRI